MDLLERESALATLEEAAAAAERGEGRFVVVEGPAGVGKSALLATLSDSGEGVLAGACDNVTIPPILGPFEDIARRVPPLDTALGSGFGTFRRALLDFLGEGSQIVTIDDLHWADQASLDLLAFVARRLHELGALVVASVRTEVPRDHPVVQMLASLRPDRAIRLRLQDLSAEAVATLAAGSAHDPHELHRVTGGNPFLVTEFLEWDGSIPPTVSESVAARVAALPTRTRTVAALMSVTRRWCSWDLLDRLVPGGSDALADLEVAGILVSAPDGIGFRHELIRQAIEESLTSSERRQHNAAVLAALEAHAAPPSVVAHHAWEAGDTETLLHRGIAAIKEAIASGAHVQALEHINRLLPLGESLPPAEHAWLLTTAAVELWRNHDLARSRDTMAVAITRWQEVGDVEQLGSTLGRAATIAWHDGSIDEFHDLRERAIEVLETIEPTEALARQYISYGQDLSLGSRMIDAVPWIDRALDLAREHGWDDVSAIGLGAREPIRLMLGKGHDTRPDGDRAIAYFSEHGHYTDLGVTYINRIAASINSLHLDHVEADLAAAEDMGRTVDLQRFETSLEMHRSRYLLLQGDWDEAHRRSSRVLDRLPSDVVRATALTVRATVGIRRGDPTAGEDLDAAIGFVWDSGDIQRIQPLASLMAESVWLGTTDDLDVVRRGYDLARTSGFERGHSEMVVWHRRLGMDAPGPETAPAPHALELASDHHSGAEIWRRWGAPYERALCLAFSADRRLMRASLDILDGLGAVVVRDKVKQMMRDRGFAVGRRQALATRANPAGLTRRQMEVLSLLADDLTNQEIAARLYISTKTVEHHVSAILTKLGVDSRRRAAALLPDLELNH